MKKLLAITILLFASSFVLAQNECPSGTYVPSWGKFTTSDGVTHQTVCIDTSARWTLPLLNSISPTTITSSFLAADGTAALPSYSFSNQTNMGFYRSPSPTPNHLQWGEAGVGQILYATSIIRYAPGITHGWTATADPVNGQADTCLSRQSAGVIEVGNNPGTSCETTPNAGGTLNAADYRVANVASSGTGGIARTTSASLTAPTISSATIITGIVGDGSGYKHKRFGASCTTAASAGSNCNSTLSWTTAFADANYTVTCFGTQASGVPILTNSTKAAASVTVTVWAATASAAQFSSIDCIASHD